MGFVVGEKITRLIEYVTNKFLIRSDLDKLKAKQ